MLIKLEYTNSTKKAYKLPRGGWIPKSVLDPRGLKHPFYKVKDWWLSNTVEKAKEEDVSATVVLKSVFALKIDFKDLPEALRLFWVDYWKSADGCVFGYDSTDRRWEIGEWEIGVYD